MPELQSIPGFTDPFSSLSHLLGGLLFLVLGFALVRRGLRAPASPHLSRRARVCSLAVFSFGAVTLLAMSAIFHLLHTGEARNFFQRMDHAAIFVLIAATFTPIHTILFRGGWRWRMLAFIWSVALAGVLLKTLFFAMTPHTASVYMYLAMGWLGLISIILVYRRRGLSFVSPVILGGLAYTIGAGIELGVTRPLVRGVIRAHEIFHVAVLIGLFCHWLFMWRIAELPAIDEPVLVTDQPRAEPVSPEPVPA